MKTCSILFWTFLFGVTVARTMTDAEMEGRKHAMTPPTSNPSFIWKTPIALHVVYPNGKEDYINLEPVLMSDTPVKCLFRGQFYSDKSSSAVISGCMEDDKVSITIVAKELWGRTAFEVTKGMVEEVVNPYAGDFDEVYDEDEDENDDQVDRDKRSTYIYEDYQDYEYTDAQYDSIANSVEPPPPLLTTPLKLAFDKSFKTKMGSEEAAKTYIRSVAELGSPYLENFSPQTKIFLNIVDEIEFFDEILEPNTNKLHRAFELKKHEKVPMVIFTSKEDNNKRMGISPGLPGKACHARKGVSIVKHRSNKTLAAMTFAHELGHDHGMKHDSKETPSCLGGGLMSVIGPDLSLSQRPTTFSSCSVARFAKWYGNKFGDCMEEGIVNKASKLKYLESKLENLEDKCSSLTASPGATLKSGCVKPDQLQDGAWACSQDGSSCHAACHEGFKSNKNSIIICDQSTWIPNPNSFLCGPLPELPDEVIFIAGGKGAYTSSELVDVAPSGGGCGKVTGQLPASRYYHSMDLLNGKLVICGGGDNTHTSCIAARSPSGPWSDHSTTTGRRFGHGSSTVGGAVHLIGGSYSTSMESWETDRWITKVNPPVNFGFGTCATNIGDNQILVIGGRPSYNKVALYRVKEDVWEELADLPAGSGRSGHGCVSLGDGQVLVGGGHDGGSWLRSCVIYQIGEGKWEDVGDMKSARSGVRFLAVNVAGKRRFYALGGYDGSYFDSIEEFDQQTKTWSVIPVRMAEGRRYFGAVVMKKANVC